MLMAVSYTHLDVYKRQEVSTVGTSGNNSVMDNAGYYKNMKTII